jgi:intracellular multiplication protein IcmB
LSEKFKENNGLGEKPGEFAQSPFMVVPAVRDYHSSMLGTIQKSFGSIARLKVLEVHDALRALRYEISPKTTPINWAPSLLGDKVKNKLVKESENKGDLSHVMNVDIAFQLFSESPTASERDQSMVEMGGLYHAPIIADSGPSDPRPFTKLFTDIDGDCPWRVCITLETGHANIVNYIQNKHTYSSYLKLFNSGNSMIRDAAAEWLDMAQSGQSTFISMKVSLCTWAETISLARRRKQIITQALQNWGDIDVVDERADSIEAWCTTLPGFVSKKLGVAFPMLLEEAIGMTPLTRPEAPWGIGSFLARTTDGKAFPISPGSELQNAWNKYIFGPPGFSKSVTLGAFSNALLMAPGAQDLPLIGVLDIGPSSESWLEFVSSTLPKDQKHRILSTRIEMTSKFAKNPFDLILGNRTPLPIDREYLINIMEALLTPAGSSEPIQRLSEIIGALVDAMYRYVDDDHNPNHYEEGVSKIVDDALDKHGIYCDENATWYQVVDALGEKEEWRAATLANRHAVPTLVEATMVLSNDIELRDTYGSSMYNSNETMFEFINGMIVSAIKEYPVLSHPTVFDIGETRLFSLDLQSVVRSGSSSANKQTAIMYLFGMNMVCGDFFRNIEETIPLVNPKFRSYHYKRLKAIEDVPRLAVFDEFHQTNGPKVEPVRRMVTTYLRVGRKNNVHTTLVSQNCDDISSEMSPLLNEVIILSPGGDEAEKAKIIDRFKPSPDARTAMAKYCHGPVPGEGSSMLYIGKMKGRKDIEQIITLTLSSQEIWALSTTDEDRKLRKFMTQKVGFKEALIMLAEFFPKGSAKGFITGKSIEMNGDSYEDEMEVPDSIIEAVALEVIRETKHLI